MVGRTTTKTRLVSPAGQPFRVRVDYDADCHPGYKDALVRACSEGVRAILVADYGKGACTPEILKALIQAAGQCGLPVLVDPAHGASWDRYEGATVIKPNIPEWVAQTDGVRDYHEDAAKALLQWSKHVVVTCGERGMCIRSSDYSASIEGRGIPADDVIDPCGAGDQSLVGLGLAIAVGSPIEDACCFANELARLCVMKHGAAPTGLDEVDSELADRFVAA